MIIKSVYIKNFGGISNKQYSLSDGLNVIFGMNEAGKSTFLSFIRFMFYGAKKQRSKELSFRDKYMPWNGKDMSGEIVFTNNGIEYSLSRTVASSGRKTDVTLINTATGDIVSDIPNDDIGLLLFGMNETSFLKTLFISSEGTIISSDGEILSKISNVSQSGDDAVSYHDIQSKINDMIAVLSSTRRSKAVIPSIEEKIISLKNKKEEITKLCERKETLSKELSEKSNLLDKALILKEDFSNKLKRINQYSDFISYKKSVKRLKEAEADFENETKNNSVGNTNKYDFLKSISEDEEKIILQDYSQQLTADKTREVILKEKSLSAKTRSIVFSVIAVASVIPSFIYPASLVATLLFASLAMWSFISFKKSISEADELTERISATENTKKSVLQKYGIESSEEYRQLKREAQDILSQNTKNHERIDAAKRRYDQQKSDFDAICALLTEKYGTIENLECDCPEETEAEISEKINSVNGQIVFLTAEKAKINVELESINDSPNLLKQIDSELEHLTAKQNDAKEELRILHLASDILCQSYEELKTNFAPKLAKSTAKIFNAMTSGKHGEIIVNDKFEIQIKNDGKYENSNYFSSGTIQQLYFSLRLGIIELISDKFPLFIDDAFITYDDERFENVSAFLKDYSKNNQIIFTTCHKRERNMKGAEILEF